MSEQRLEEVRSEIERLEADHNLSSEEFKELKALKAEAKELEAKIEAELANKSLSVRPLQRRDIQVLQTLIKDYPGFSSLTAEDKLDRMVLVLTNVCGFGGVLVETLETALNQLSYPLPLDIEKHFENSTWTNREGEQRKRYVNNFARAFKLDPGLSLKLVDEGRSSSEEEPIRKVVPGKKKPEPVRVSKPQKETASVRKIVEPSAKPELKQELKPEVKVEAKADGEPDALESASPRNLKIMIVGASLVLILLAVLVLVFS